jgi:uncharacterized membrane protein
MNAAEAIVGSAITVGLLDAGWLTLRYNYHNDLFYKIQKSEMNPRLIPAVLIYLLIPVAIFLYAVRDATNTKEAALKGALIGFILYAFYDLTNFATLTNYTLDMTLTDIAWGTAVCTVGAAVGYRFYTR